MIPREIKKNIYHVGAIDWDRQLFDELIPLPDGTTYNSYFIKGSEKNALVDTVDPEKAHELFHALSELGVDELHYLIVNHAEQDHSGTIPAILEEYPEVKIITNKKCRDILETHLHLSPEVFQVVGDRETLSLGDITLEFIIAPWVHWPDTMLTYVQEKKILFSCDLFGSHNATSHLFVQKETKTVEDAKRYYAEIMMPFRKNIQKHLNIIDTLDIEIIGASHGPLYDNPSLIIDAYKYWVSDTVVNKVVIPYISMHESTKYMVDLLCDSLMKRGVPFVPFNLTVADTGEIAKELVDAATVVIATPTVLAGPHPAAVSAAYLVNAIRPKTQNVGIIGSYGWGGRTVDILKDLLKNLNAEIFEPVLVKGLPRDEEIDRIDQLAEMIAEKHKELE